MMIKRVPQIKYLLTARNFKYIIKKRIVIIWSIEQLFCFLGKKKPRCFFSCILILSFCYIDLSKLNIG
jgi:hypothetical protein